MKQVMIFRDRKLAAMTKLHFCPTREIDTTFDLKISQQVKKGAPPIDMFSARLSPQPQMCNLRRSGVQHAAMLLAIRRGELSDKTQDTGTSASGGCQATGSCYSSADSCNNCGEISQRSGLESRGRERHAAAAAAVAMALQDVFAAARRRQRRARQVCE